MTKSLPEMGPPRWMVRAVGLLSPVKDATIRDLHSETETTALFIITSKTTKDAT
ncbi:hypothetical protein [Kluyvera georgiana]|uniref:hypothetical protein n=1 Tax=Kluyvera georgiana TaxID=73098 RepID=UPI000A87D47E|nr:hypothetical protein [Kluyvera georgiana]